MTTDQFAAGIEALIARADDAGQVLDRIVKAMKDALTSDGAEPVIVKAKKPKPRR